MACPDCGNPEAWTFCWTCERYVGDGQLGITEPAEFISDSRPESEIRMAIRAALQLCGFIVVDFEQGYRRDGTTRVRKGLADLYVMGYGVSAWVEVKSTTGRQTQEQKAFADDCARAGIPYMLWRHEGEALHWAKNTKQEVAA